jgi:hypothetical protein
MATTLERPPSTEHPEFHAGYISVVPEGDVLQILETQLEEAITLLGGIGEDRANHRYAPEKWSIKEVVGHVVDIERVFSYRAMRIARGDTTPLAGVEQDDLVAGAGFDARSLESLIEEFRSLRLANLVLFRSFDDVALMRSCKTDTYDVSVRSLIYVVAGHERHHMNVLRERYLPV